uniref:Uncharacterized protein n=1 Tax=Neogoniolithon spectabile TaxID=231755 RepID=A0A3G3MGZ6_9FLOR|nr:hypothetical protein [Neogoniolithon spectabile]AYR06093.1 hypothetical protein [Neogoniolithon spectabile]
MYTQAFDTYNKPEMQIQSRYIEKQLLILLKYIHLASKKMRYFGYRRSQKKLLSDREYHLVFIRKVVDRLKKKYMLSNRYVEKITISMYCLCNLDLRKNYWIVHFIKQQIEQYKTEIFLRAFFQGKSKTNLLTDMVKNKHSIKKKILYITFYDQGFIKDFINYEIYQTNICKANNLNNLLVLPREKILVSYWIDNNLITNEQYRIDSLDRLLVNILFIGLKWHIYINLADIIKHRKNKCAVRAFCSSDINDMELSSDSLIIFSRFVLRVSHSLNYLRTYYDDYRINYKEFLHYIDKNLLYSAKHLIYKKNHQNRWKIQNNINVKQVKSRLKLLLFNWHLNNQYRGLFDYVRSTNKKIDNMLYLWQMKK